LSAANLPAPIVETRYRVLYRDVDRMGVLYHSRYLDLFESGRTEWARAQGWRYRDMEDRDRLMLPVTNASCRFLSSIRFDDEAVVRTALIAWSLTTIRYGYEAWSAEEGTLCVVGQVELACVRREDMRPARMPAAFAQILERVAPERKGRHRE
jgi:acyl-CoA thioester hydrolase